MIFVIRIGSQGNEESWLCYQYHAVYLQVFWDKNNDFVSDISERWAQWILIQSIFIGINEKEYIKI